jgi:hypothetical protein
MEVRKDSTTAKDRAPGDEKCAGPVSSIVSYAHPGLEGCSNCHYNPEHGGVVPFTPSISACDGLSRPLLLLEQAGDAFAFSSRWLASAL